MMMLSLSTLSFLALLATSSNGLSVPEAKNHHRSIARRMDGHVDIHKRFDASKWTYYDVGLFVTSPSVACSEADIHSQWCLWTVERRERLCTSFPLPLVID